VLCDPQAKDEYLRDLGKESLTFTLSSWGAESDLVHGELEDFCLWFRKKFQSRSTDERKPHVRLRNRNGGGGRGGRGGRGGGRGGSASPSAPSTTRKAGDWDCSSCGAMNFAKRGSCYSCSQPREGSSDTGSGTVDESVRQPSNTRKPGDWDCSSCGAMNFAKRGSCYSCSQPRDGTSSPSGAGGSVRNPSEHRKAGDWDCGHCQAMNFASRSKCYKCGEDKY
jgi:hypothetical protein